MKICFITSNYPSKENPHIGVFVQELVRAISKLCIKCEVIRPLSIFKIRNTRKQPLLTYDEFNSSNPIKIWSPIYLSASNKKFLFFNSDVITQFFFNRAIQNIIKRKSIFADIYYGHFFCPSGIACSKVAKKNCKKSFIAVGESEIEQYNQMYSSKKLSRQFMNISGFISVSEKNKKFCQEQLQIPESKIVVLPNCVDQSLFYLRNRDQIREKYGFPKEVFIIAFVGHFITRKGPDRLLQAVQGIDNIKLLLIGDGPCSLKSNKIIFKGIIQHNILPEYLSAADIFVLPTRSEGCCNSILEALACGLPVISSDKNFNDTYLNRYNSLRIDTNNIEEIRKAIIRLYNDKKLRDILSRNALKTAKKYDINLRASKIIEFISKILQIDISNLKMLK